MGCCAEYDVIILRSRMEAAQPRCIASGRHAAPQAVTKAREGRVLIYIVTSDIGDNSASPSLHRNISKQGLPGAYVTSL